jgi:hypothetical protein
MHVSRRVLITAVLIVVGLMVVEVGSGLIAGRQGNTPLKNAAGGVSNTPQGQEEATSGSSTTVNTVQKVSQSVQSLLTALAFILGGAWAIYTFVLGRTIAGTVQIQIEPKAYISKQGNHSAVVSVPIKNIGRTLITKADADIQVVPITDEHLKLQRPAMRLMHASLDPELSRMAPPRGYPKSIPLFEGRAARLEPGEEVSEDVLLMFGEFGTAKVEAMFSGYLFSVFGNRRKEKHRRRWSARTILTVEGLDEEPKKPPLRDLEGHGHSELPTRRLEVNDGQRYTR